MTRRKPSLDWIKHVLADTDESRERAALAARGIVCDAGMTSNDHPSIGNPPQEPAHDPAETARRHGWSARYAPADV